MHTPSNNCRATQVNPLPHVEPRERRVRGHDPCACPVVATALGSAWRLQSQGHQLGACVWLRRTRLLSCHTDMYTCITCPLSAQIFFFIHGGFHLSRLAALLLCTKHGKMTGHWGNRVVTFEQWGAGTLLVTRTCGFFVIPWSAPAPHSVVCSCCPIPWSALAALFCFELDPLQLPGTV